MRATGDVTVEVIIGQGRKGEVRMLKGEFPEGVAKRFAEQYGLGQGATVLLRDLLEKELRAKNSSKC